jgi:GNAT superfamily N-acetyltransferase
MARLEIRDLSDDLLDAAGTLLADRHRAHRLREPALDARYEEPALARAEIAELLTGEGSTGRAALRDGSLVGYLVGAGRDPSLWGPNMWVNAAGHAASEPEALRELYAASAGGWVDEGRSNHSVIVPAGDELLIGAWFSLGFGRQHVHAIRETPGADFRPAVPPGIEIRRATAADTRALAELDLVAPIHHAASPVFSRAPIPSFEEAFAEIEDEAFVDDPRFTTFVAVHQGRVIGCGVGTSIDESREHSGMARPPGAAFLGYAAVLPEARRLGAGRAVGDAILAWARDDGRRMIVADWRSTNLEANRTWTALGFRPTFHRLHRAIVD